MSRSTKQAWLEGPGDLQEADVEDVPVKGQTVRVRGLPAAYSNEATTSAAKFIANAHGEQVATYDTGVMEVLQFAHGCVDPTFTVDEAREIAQKYGPAFKKVVAKIDELSGVDKEAIENAAASFPVGERRANGSAERVEVPAAAGDL